MVLISISLMISDLSVFLHVPVGHRYIFFGKTSIQVSVRPFLKNNVLMLSCMSFWYVLDINPLLDMSFANIFSHSLGSFFVLVILKESEVAQWCPTLCDPMGCSLPGFSFHGIFQARILEWVAISFSRKSS